MTSLSWQRSIEQIALANKRHRLLGFSSVHRGSGVSLVSRLVAKTLAAGGSRVLLVDLSEPQLAASAIDGPLVSAAALRSCIVSSSHEFDILPGAEPEEVRASFNLMRLREILVKEFSEYQHIILDLPPILDSGDGGFNTVAAAAICERLLLICAVGKDRQSEVTEVVSLLRKSGVELGAVVSNELFLVDVRKELRRLSPLRLWR